MVTCLDLIDGEFVDLPWTQSASRSQGAVTVTWAGGGANDTITVARAGYSSLALPSDPARAAGARYHYILFGEGDINPHATPTPLVGDPFAVVLETRTKGRIPNQEAEYTVYVVDMTTPPASLPTPAPAISTARVFKRSYLPTKVGRPSIAASPSNTSPGVKRTLFFVKVPDKGSNNWQLLRICRSDNGNAVLSKVDQRGLVWDPKAEIQSRTGLHPRRLYIEHPKNRDPTAQQHPGRDGTAGDLPAGKLAVGALSFAPTVVGVPSSATVTITNVGNDCITVNSISNSAPFTWTALTDASGGAVTLPHTLPPGEALTLTVQFAPQAPNQSYSGTIRINTPRGPFDLGVNGRALTARASVAVSPAEIEFDAKRIGETTKPKKYTISNDGTLEVGVTVGEPPRGSDFSWKQLAQRLKPGASLTAEVTYTPTQRRTSGEISITATTLDLTRSAPRKAVVLRGCVPRGEVRRPIDELIDFKSVGHGFRLVRMLRLENGGDGDVGFKLRVATGDKENFGLQEIGEDVTNAKNEMSGSIAPRKRCGGGRSGTGTKAVGVVFHAKSDPVPATKRAVLEIEDSTSGRTSEVSLVGRVVAASPLDASLVFDQSYSMNARAGRRKKIEAAAAAGELFAQLLRPEPRDRLAFVVFDTEPDPKVKLTEARGNRRRIVQKLKGLTPRGDTNIAGGLIEGDQQLTDHARVGATKVMILLTDGKENRFWPRGGAGRPYTLRGGRFANTSTKKYRPPAGIRIYAIGVGAGAKDDDLLHGLTKGTGGYFGEVLDLAGDDYFKLEKYFTQVLMESIDLSVIKDPFHTLRSGEHDPHRFEVLPGDLGVLVVVYDAPGRRLPFKIETPDGSIFDGLSVPPEFAVRAHTSETARFVEIKFPEEHLPKHAVGTWRVTVSHPGATCQGDFSYGLAAAGDEDDAGAPSEGFLPHGECEPYPDPVEYGIAIGAGSNLRMQPYVDPGYKRPGDPIRLSATIAESGVPVTGAAVEVQIKTPTRAARTVRLRDTFAAGSHAREDGSYEGVFTETGEVGPYELTFVAEGVRAGTYTSPTGEEMQRSQRWRREAERQAHVHDPRDSEPGPGESCCDELVALLREALGLEPQEDLPESESADYG